MDSYSTKKTRLSWIHTIQLLYNSNLILFAFLICHSRFDRLLRTFWKDYCYIYELCTSVCGYSLGNFCGKGWTMFGLNFVSILDLVQKTLLRLDYICLFCLFYFHCMQKHVASHILRTNKEHLTLYVETRNIIMISVIFLLYCLAFS